MRSILAPAINKLVITYYKDSCYMNIDVMLADKMAVYEVYRGINSCKRIR